MNNEERALKSIREKIDKVDYQIHDLLNKRAEYALEVCKIKCQHNHDISDFVRPEREKQIFEAINAHNKGPFSSEAVTRIFRLIINESIQLQKNHKKQFENDL